MKISRWVLPRHEYGTRNYMNGDDSDALVDYIDREPELKALLQVAENIGAVNIFYVDFAYFKASLHSGRVAVHWHCRMGADHFDMHMTLALWDVQEWQTTGKLECSENASGIFSLDVADRNLTAWKKACLKSLDAMDHLTLSHLIGQPTYLGSWRVLMFPTLSTRDLMVGCQCALEDALGLNGLNVCLTKDLHFSLDKLGHS